MTHTRISALGLLCIILSPAALAQQNVGTVSSKAPATLLGGGPKPTLLEPAPDTEIATQPTRSTPVLFRWAAPAGGPAPQRYRLCIAEQNVSCDTQQAAIYEVGAVTQYQAQVPPRFHEKTLQWSVAACGPGYGGGVSVAGATITDCNWSSTRRLQAGYQPPLITLLSPLPGTAVNPSQRFTWQAPRGQAVEKYQLCIADNAAECAQPRSHGPLRFDVDGSRTFADVTLSRGSQARPRQWTVLTCRQNDCRLAANQPHRPFTIPAYTPPPPINVEVTITDIRVRRRCDNASPGDWAMRLGAWEGRAGRTEQTAKANWPSSGSHNVSDREWVHLNHTLHLKDVHPESHIGATVSAVDCDADGIWTPFRLFQGTEGIAAIISDWQAHCGGEEVWEASGHNDFAGVATLRIPPEEWKGAKRKRFSAVSEGSEACDDPAFTMHVEVTSSQ